MKHRLKGKKLNRTSSHRKALLKNLAQALIKHEQILTTLIKAKSLKPVVDKLITIGKKGDLHARRQAITKLGNTKLVAKIFDVLAKRYEKRNGGYSRVIRAGFRYGDDAPMAIIELVDRDAEAKKVDLKKKTEEKTKKTTPEKTKETPKKVKSK